MKHISALTLAVDTSLMMEMYTQDNSSIIHIQYDHFKVAGASNDYKLTISGYSGNNGEALKWSGVLTAAYWRQKHTITNRLSHRIACLYFWHK